MLLAGDGIEGREGLLGTGSTRGLLSGRGSVGDVATKRSVSIFLVPGSIVAGFVLAVGLPLLAGGETGVGAALGVGLTFVLRLRSTVFPSTAPRTCSKLSMKSQTSFHTETLSRRSTKFSRSASRNAWISPIRSRLLRDSEYVDMRIVTATISTGANVWTPRSCLFVFVKVFGSSSMRSWNVFQTLARWDLIPSSTAPVFSSNFGK